ncbi:hypothetical protein BDR26DRAFT_858569 [Obelidium mucronatum]|nr:hypothetical protein BDR26DRAFT_858569 [Obelidium mucronatum]
MPSTATFTGTETTTAAGPNEDCLTIKQAFTAIQFNIDCYNVPENLKYMVSKTALARRMNRRSGTLRQRSVKTYIQFQNSRIVEVVLPNMELAGPISPLLGNLGKLSTLDLSGNQFSGVIPEELSRCNLLQSVSLENNQLTGHVPATLLVVLSNNKATVEFGTNCLENRTKQRKSCKNQPKEDNCFHVALNTRYTGSEYRRLWDALALSNMDMKAFDKLSQESDNFSFGEYMFQGFRKYAAELVWCMQHHPEYSYRTV